MAIIPASKPNLTRAGAIDELNKHLGQTPPNAPLFVIGIRGYYKDSMGKAGANDRGIYDDAICVVSTNAFAAFNGNVDPSIFRKGIASLKPGIYYFQKHKHKGKYWAFGQSRPVTVIRDQEGEQTGMFGINIHHGGANATFSEGCQTLPPSQWDAFKNLVYSEMDRLGLKEFPYILIED